MSLTELPVELFHRICDVAEDKEILNLRLVSRTISAVADEYLLRVIPLHFIRLHFDNAERLCKSNRRVANAVRDLHFQADRYRPALDYQDWLEMVETTKVTKASRRGEVTNLSEIREFNSMHQRAQRRIRRQLKRVAHNATAQHTKAQLDAAHENFIDVVNDQLRMSRENSARKCFTQLFGLCPKLDSITVSLQDQIHEPLPYGAVQSFSRCLVEPAGDKVSNRPGLYPLNDVLLAAYESGRTLKHIYVVQISYQFFAQDTSTMSKIFEVIGKVEDLFLELNAEHHTDREEPPWWEVDHNTDLLEFRHAHHESKEEAINRVMAALEDGRLARFLSHATSVNDLSIILPQPRNKDPPRVTALSDIVGETVWPNLTEICLGNFECTTDELADLYLRHRDTLEVVHLAEVTFRKGTWRQCFVSLAGKLPRLRRLMLGGEIMDRTSTITVNNPPNTTVMERWIIDGGDCPAILDEVTTEANDLPSDLAAYFLD